MKREGQEVSERMTSYLSRLKESVDKAQDFIEKYGLKNPREIKEAAIRFVLTDSRVHSLCLAFNTFEDVENHLKLSGSRLSGLEKQKLAAFEQGCGSLYCRHACGICESRCPEGVAVNTILRYNHYFEAHGSEKYAMERYAGLETARADRCSGCVGHCEAACPYGIPVKALLNMAHGQLTLA
jgi:predicted aldo/keto reductase-like oxidoreductase